MQGTFTSSGLLSVKKIRPANAPLLWRLKNILRWQFIHGWLAVFVGVPLAKAFGLATMYGKLEALLIKANGEKINYGVLGYRVVTTAYVNFISLMLVTDATTIGDFKYHDSGVGATAENVTDTDIQTTDGESRVAGTQVNNTANTYTSVGTISYTTTKAITEHGLFNASTGVTLMDRTVFSAVNVVSGDSIQFTYTLTNTAGS